MTRDFKRGFIQRKKFFSPETAARLCYPRVFHFLLFFFSVFEKRSMKSFVSRKYMIENARADMNVTRELIIIGIASLEHEQWKVRDNRETEFANSIFSETIF